MVGVPLKGVRGFIGAYSDVIYIYIFFFCGCSYNKEDSILVSILGSPYLGKLPCTGRSLVSMALVEGYATGAARPQHPMFTSKLQVLISPAKTSAQSTCKTSKS